MIILLTITEKKMALILKDQDVVVDQRQWHDENNLSEMFLPYLNELLVENTLSIEEISDFSLETDVPTGYTTARIARTIIKTLNFAKA